MFRKLSTNDILQQMKSPTGEHCTPDISDKENENFVQFNKCVRLPILS